MDMVIRTCDVLHNLTIDYEREHNVDGGYINDADYLLLHRMVLVPCNPNQSVEEREVLMASMQNMEQHNLLQHGLMVERWEAWIALNGDDNMEDDINKDNTVQW